MEKVVMASWLGVAFIIGHWAVFRGILQQGMEHIVRGIPIAIWHGAV